MKKRGSVATPSWLDPDSLPETLHDVLDSRMLRERFRGFLEARLAIESLLFYECIELYEQIEPQRGHLRQKVGKSLVERFVEEESPDWVNISATLREDLTKGDEFTAESFSAAKREVFALMTGNFLDSFRKDLQGTDVETAPKLSVDSHLTQSFYRTHSFEQLAEALGESLHEETGSHPSRPSISGPCTCHETRSISSVLSRRSSYNDICCERRKHFPMKALRRKGKLKIERLAHKLTPSSILRRKKAASRTSTVTSGDASMRTAPNRSRFFSNGCSYNTTREMSIWKEVEQEQELEHQV